MRIQCRMVFISRALATKKYTAPLRIRRRQQRDDGRMPELDGHIEGGFASPGLGVHVCAMLQEQRHSIRASVTSRKMESAPAIIVLGVDVRAML